MEGAGQGLEVQPGDGPDAYVLRMDGMDQSYVDLADPTALHFPYVRRLGDLLDLCAPAGQAVRAVHVGGAGLTLPRYVAATRPRSSQVVLEPARELTALVRAELPLPKHSGIRVRDVDGRAGLAALRDGYADVVVLDAFHAGRVPGDLVTREACAEIGRVLVPTGVVLLNLIDRSPFPWSRRVMAALRTVWPALVVTAEPATLRGRRSGNLVVAASHGRLPVDVLRDRVATALEPFRVLDDAAVRDSLGGGEPFTDADREDSPAIGPTFGH